MITSVSMSTLFFQAQLLGIPRTTILGDRFGLLERPPSVSVEHIGVRPPSQIQDHGSFALQTLLPDICRDSVFARNSLITQWGALVSVCREGSTDIGVSGVSFLIILSLSTSYSLADYPQGRNTTTMCKTRAVTGRFAHHSIELPYIHLFMRNRSLAS